MMMMRSLCVVFLFRVLFFFRCPLVLPSDRGSSLSSLALADFRLFHDWLVVDFLCFHFRVFQVRLFSGVSTIESYFNRV